MEKKVILITGTPCVGKTSVARELAQRLDALYINLTEFSKKYNLAMGEDEMRHTTVIDENKMHQKLAETINITEKSDIVVDGHYAPAVTPKGKVTLVFVLRRNPIELHEIMVKNGFKDRKLWENLASEILDSCLVDALQAQNREKVCELDVSGKPVAEIVNDILAVLNGCKKCRAGGIDWLGMLEQQGKIDEYLKI
ncbi:MAG TPA: adenylate kinase family protein [Candidatus Bathyarchaeia archaeon]